MNMSSPLSSRRAVIQGQRGVTTLAITLMLLIIITLVVMFSTNVAFFEQRTSNNENRARLSEQAAEYALNLSGEFLKANVANIVTTGTGWLGASGTRRWSLCSGVSPMATDHPCMAESDGTRRNQLYFYNFAGSAALPYNTTNMGAGVLSLIGESGISGDDTGFVPDTKVEALLCRLDTTLTVPQCRANPDAVSANRIAVVLIATTTMAGENSKSVVKETWASISQSLGGSAVPLVAAGTVKGLGTATIVAGPNGGGTGIPVSVWSPCPVSIDGGDKDIGANAYTSGCSAPGIGVGSVQTCELDAYLQNGTIPVANLQTTCAANSKPCSCPNTGDGSLSSGGSSKTERHDILDRDGYLGKDDAQGINSIPDITFFPTGKETRCPAPPSPLPANYSCTANLKLDSATDPLDDSMFEWIFGQDIMPENATTVPNNCGAGNAEDCALVAMRDNLGATVVAGCSGFGPTSSGLFYVTGGCGTNSTKFPNNTNVGSPNNPVVIVIDGDVGGEIDFSANFHGVLFIRSDNDSASFSSTGGMFFGSVVVEGEVDMKGNVHIVYVNIATETPGKPLPASTRFAKVTGSWLDNNTGF